KVIVVRDQRTKDALGDLNAPAAKRYAAQQKAGESPWNTVVPTAGDAPTTEATPPPARLTDAVKNAPVVLVICVDLSVVPSPDQNLHPAGIVRGPLFYPF